MKRGLPEILLTKSPVLERCFRDKLFYLGLLGGLPKSGYGGLLVGLGMEVIKQSSQWNLEKPDSLGIWTSIPFI